MITRAKYFAITAVAIVGATAAARADAPAVSRSADPSYPALAPAAIRIDHNAASITIACRAAEHANLDTCRDYQFCKDPLDAKEIPNADELKVLASGQCPVSSSSHGSSGVGAAPPAPAGAVTTKSIVGLGSVWQSDVITGIADFLVARAKAELVASLVFQLQADLCAEHDWILPATCGLLANAAPYSVPVSWNALKLAFMSDLRDLPEIVIDKLETDVDKSQPLRALVQAMILVGQGAGPLDTVAGLRVKYAAIASPPMCTANPYACGLLVLGNAVEILAPSPLANEASKDAAFVELQLKIAARLLYDVGSQVGLVADLKARLDAYRPILQDLIDRLLAVRAAAQLTQNTMGSMSAAPTTAERATVRSVVDNYARCVTATFAMPVVAALVPALAKDPAIGRFEDVIKHLGAALDHARAGEYMPAFVEIGAALGFAGITPPAWFNKYGGFLADVASAKTAGDAQKAIEAAAAPVGSWRQKRGAHNTAWINGYLGGQVGVEHLFGTGAVNDYSFQGGLFAPIGLEVDHGFSGTWSVGLLASALDLGALVDFRAASDKATVKTNANVGARQVFSPGAYVLLGIGLGKGGVPLTLGAGASISPELRSIELGNGTTRDVNALRFNAFLAVDVSIFRL
ncbi:MAG TPA: hypothetical protein VFP84_39265 [Kofleriaceae bacterium]|nr:hypothetical protein [Kofleriaceae bacterium]